MCVWVSGGSLKVCFIVWLRVCDRFSVSVHVSCRFICVCELCVCVCLGCVSGSFVCVCVWIVWNECGLACMIWGVCVCVKVVVGAQLCV